MSGLLSPEKRADVLATANSYTDAQEALEEAGEGKTAGGVQDVLNNFPPKILDVFQSVRKSWRQTVPNTERWDNGQEFIEKAWDNGTDPHPCYRANYIRQLTMKTVFFQVLAEDAQFKEYWKIEDRRSILGPLQTALRSKEPLLMEALFQTMKRIHQTTEYTYEDCYR